MLKRKQQEKLKKKKNGKRKKNGNVEQKKKGNDWKKKRENVKQKRKDVKKNWKLKKKGYDKRLKLLEDSDQLCNVCCTLRAFAQLCYSALRCLWFISHCRADF